MKIQASPDISNIKDEEIKRFATIVLAQIVGAVNGNLTIQDNILGQQASVSFVSANTDTAISHTLNRQVTQYLVLNRSTNMVIYDGATAANNTTVYLKSSAIGTATVFLL